jgi:hypothetical protein
MVEEEFETGDLGVDRIAGEIGPSPSISKTACGAYWGVTAYGALNKVSSSEGECSGNESWI